MTELNEYKLNRDARGIKTDPEMRALLRELGNVHIITPGQPRAVHMSHRANILTSKSAMQIHLKHARKHERVCIPVE